MNTLTDTERGWVAGLFEGEGTIVASVSNYKWLYPRLAVTQLDRSVLEHLAAVTGLGTISGPRKRGSPTYYWQLARRSDVSALLKVIEPLLSARRQSQIRNVYERCGHEYDCI